MMYTMNPSFHLYKVLDYINDYVSDEHIQIKLHEYKNKTCDDVKVRYFITVNYYVNNEQQSKINRYVSKFKNVDINFKYSDDVSGSSSFISSTVRMSARGGEYLANPDVYNNRARLYNIYGSNIDSDSNSNKTKKEKIKPLEPEVKSSKWDNIIIKNLRKCNIYPRNKTESTYVLNMIMDSSVYELLIIGARLIAMVPDGGVDTQIDVGVVLYRERTYNNHVKILIRSALKFETLLLFVNEHVRIISDYSNINMSLHSVYEYEICENQLLHNIIQF